MPAPGGQIKRAGGGNTVTEACTGVYAVMASRRASRRTGWAHGMRRGEGSRERCACAMQIMLCYV